MSRRRRSRADSRATRRIDVERWRDGVLRPDSDVVTMEEPLEIRLVVEEAGVRRAHSLAVTMRTPGADFELAAGFLVSEGVVRERSDIWRIDHCPDTDAEAAENIVEVTLAPDIEFNLDQLSRNVVTTSACGICGRTSIEAVRQICTRPLAEEPKVPVGVLSGLTDKLEQKQSVFARTGGLHAAALFDSQGERLLLREDVGRHNAFDKMVGALLDDGLLPAAHQISMVSGRASFELVQKSLLAGIPMLVAVGAPSSLAIDLAAEYGMSLIGFLRADSFNVYCGAERLVSD